MKRLLVLRPEPGASETVQRAQALGLAAVAVPLFEVEPVEWAVPEAGGFDGLLLTSANAVRHAGDGLKELRGLRAYAVGASTADAARHAGFDVASTGNAGVERLLGSIEADLKLLHLAGEDRREPANPRQDIRAISVYRSKAKDVVLEDVKDSVPLIHSRRAGQRFAEMVGSGDKSQIAIAAISEEVANAAGSGWASVDVAEGPNDEALLALAERLCKNSSPK